MFKGTERRSALDIAKEIDSIGGMSNAFTSRENTCYHAKVLDNHLDQVVDLLTDIFLNSLFVPEELKREQEVVLQEIKMVEDTPDEHVHQLLPEVFWQGDLPGPAHPGQRGECGRLQPRGLAGLHPGRLQPGPDRHRGQRALEHERLVELVRSGFSSPCPPIRVRPGPRPRPEPRAT